MKTGSKHSEEAKEKNRLAHLGKATWNGKHHTEETKAKLSLINKGKPSPRKGVILSEDTKKKISEANKGKLSWKGKHHTKETKEKLSLILRGKPSPRKGEHHSEEAKQKNRLAHLGKPTWNKGVPTSEDIKRKQSIQKKEYIKNHPEVLDSLMERGLKNNRRHIKTKSGQIVRSKPEAKIADWLFEQNINFEYERKLILEGIKLYPDFYLPKHKIYVEYYGQWGYKGVGLDKRTEKKIELYKKHNISVISLFFKDLQNAGKILEKALKSNL